MSKHKQDYDEDEEVRIKKVRISGFIIGAIVGAVFYIGIPYAMIHYVEPNFDSYMEQLNVDLHIAWDSLTPLFERWMYAGVPMTLLGALTWSCPKGSRQRFFMSTVYLAASIVWLLYVLNFGVLPDLISITVDGNTYEFGLVLYFLLYLIVLFRALKILILFGVYKDSRDDYLEGE